MAANKSNVAITMIRTGNGDDGDTKLGGKAYRKGHALIQYLGALDTVQAFTDALPYSWGDYEPRNLAQELLFQLSAAVHSRTPKQKELYLQEIAALMEKQIEYISGGLHPLDSFLRCHETNGDLQRLRTFVREAERLAVQASDYIELTEKDTSEQLLYILKPSAAALNVLSDWVFAFVWLMSTQENGRVLKSVKWVPMSEEQVRSLNDD